MLGCGITENKYVLGILLSTNASSQKNEKRACIKNIYSWSRSNFHLQPSIWVISGIGTLAWMFHCLLNLAWGWPQELLVHSSACCTPSATTCNSPSGHQKQPDAKLRLMLSRHTAGCKNSTLSAPVVPKPLMCDEATDWSAGLVFSSKIFNLSSYMECCWPKKER